MINEVLRIVDERNDVPSLHGPTEQGYKMQVNFAYFLVGKVSVILLLATTTRISMSYGRICLI